MAVWKEELKRIKEALKIEDRDARIRAFQSLGYYVTKRTAPISPYKGDWVLYRGVLYVQISESYTYGKESDQIAVHIDKYVIHSKDMPDLF